MAPIDEKKLREGIIKEITELEKTLNLAAEDEDEVMQAFYMGSQTALLKLLTTINDI